MELHQFPSGYPTTAGTLRLLARLVRENEAHPRIRARARQIVGHLPSIDVDGEIAAIWEWVTTRVRYVAATWRASIDAPAVVSQWA